MGFFFTLLFQIIYSVILLYGYEWLRVSFITILFQTCLCLRTSKCISNEFSLKHQEHELSLVREILRLIRSLFVFFKSSEWSEHKFPKWNYSDPITALREIRHCNISHQKEGILTVYINVDGNGGYYVKQN